MTYTQPGMLSGDTYHCSTCSEEQKGLLKTTTIVLYLFVKGMQKNTHKEWYSQLKLILK